MRDTDAIRTTDEKAGGRDAAEALGLRALVWTLVEPERAMRLLDVTGLTPADLRTRASDPAVLSAALGFLEAYEPDLIACATSMDVTPQALVRARALLETT